MCGPAHVQLVTELIFAAVDPVEVELASDDISELLQFHSGEELTVEDPQFRECRQMDCLSINSSATTNTALEGGTGDFLSPSVFSYSYRLLAAITQRKLPTASLCITRALLCIVGTNAAILTTAANSVNINFEEGIFCLMTAVYVYSIQSSYDPVVNKCTWFW